jgi:hypothetical protein
MTAAGASYAISELPEMRIGVSDGCLGRSGGLCDMLMAVFVRLETLKTSIILAALASFDPDPRESAAWKCREPENMQT